MKRTRNKFPSNLQNFPLSLDNSNYFAQAICDCYIGSKMGTAVFVLLAFAISLIFFSVVTEKLQQWTESQWPLSSFSSKNHLLYSYSTPGQWLLSSFGSGVSSAFHSRCGQIWHSCLGQLHQAYCKMLFPAANQNWPIDFGLGRAYPGAEITTD